VYFWKHLKKPKSRMLITPYLRVALLVFVLAGGITYLITRFAITPKYESTAVIFTANTHANIHLVSAGIRFGYDKEIGEQLEILNASAVRDALVAAFNLITEYDIDTASAFWQEELLREYNNNISLNRTINKSIEITVRDADPHRAADMANGLVALADAHKNEVIKGNIKLAADAALASYKEKAALIAEMTDSLEAMRQAGESVWTFGEERKSGRYQNYELQYRKELDRYHYLKQNWEELDDLLRADTPKSYVVSTAIASGKPVYPKKGLLALLAGALAALGYIALRNLSLK
jgi:uncharacterized protein involved in exopolysaccharide biosynthesis